MAILFIDEILNAVFIFSEFGYKKFDNIKTSFNVMLKFFISADRAIGIAETVYL